MANLYLLKNSVVDVDIFSSIFSLSGNQLVSLSCSFSLIQFLSHCGQMESIEWVAVCLTFFDCQGIFTTEFSTALLWVITVNIFQPLSLLLSPDLVYCLVSRGKMANRSEAANSSLQPQKYSQDGRGTSDIDTLIPRTRGCIVSVWSERCRTTSQPQFNSISTAVIIIDTESETHPRWCPSHTIIVSNKNQLT